jgi:hypothetical protein
MIYSKRKILQEAKKNKLYLTYEQLNNFIKFNYLKCVTTKTGDRIVHKIKQGDVENLFNYLKELKNKFIK